MSLESPQLDRIVSDPTILDGQPRIRGTRLTVRRVLMIISTLRSPEAIAQGYPQLEDEDIRQALTYAAALIEDRVIQLKPAS